MTWYKWKFWIFALGKVSGADMVIDSHVWVRIWRTNLYIRCQKSQPAKIRKNNIEDICLWPDGYWCFWEEIESYNWKSDDYEILEVGSRKWEDALILDGFIEGEWQEP
jgi:hypothetical protein